MKLVETHRIDEDSCRFTVQMPNGEAIESICKRHSDEPITGFSFDNAKLNEAIMRGVIDGRELTKLLASHFDKNH